MPCNSIITQSVDLERCSSAELLDKAITALGGHYDQYSKRHCVRDGDYWFYVVNGQVIGERGSVGQVADKIKRSYAKAAIKQAAARNGWNVKEVSENKLQVIKR